MQYINLKYALVAFTMLLIFSGCSSTNLNLTKKDNFIKYDNTNHIVGEKINSIKTLVYVEKIDDKIDKKVTFYIDKFPYEQSFSLCSDKKDFKIVKTVITDSNGNKKAIYENDPIDCDGKIYINKDGFGSHKLWFLSGFMVHDFKGYDLLLAHKSGREVSGFSIYDRQASIGLHNSESYWYFE